MRIVSPVSGQVDPTRAGRPRTTGTMSVSVAHQANTTPTPSKKTFRLDRQVIKQLGWEDR
jgi:hypothetical protein